jgi:hypothetical protein
MGIGISPVEDVVPGHVAPYGAGGFFGLGFYKDGAPTVLGRVLRGLQAVKDL